MDTNPPFSIDTNPQSQTFLVCKVLRPMSGFFSSHTTPQAIPTLESPANDSVRSLLPKQVTDFVNEGATKLVKVPESSSSKASMPSPDPGTVYLKPCQSPRGCCLRRGPRYAEDLELQPCPGGTKEHLQDAVPEAEAQGPKVLKGLFYSQNF